MDWIKELEKLSLILPYALSKSKVDEINAYRNAISEAIWSFEELQKLYEEKGNTNDND